MNDQLKEKLEEAAKSYANGYTGSSGHVHLECGFVKGAEWLYSQGYRFTEEDMRAAFNAGVSHMDEDAWADSVGYKRKHPEFDQWLEERRKGQ